MLFGWFSIAMATGIGSTNSTPQLVIRETWSLKNDHMPSEPGFLMFLLLVLFGLMVLAATILALFAWHGGGL